MADSDTNQASQTSLIGERYRVLRVIGRGGMALVYEAIDEATGKHLAVKQLHAQRASGDGHMARLFATEFHTLTQLAHPRVVAVYDYQTLPDGAFYTMELLDGGDLYEQKKLPWREACALLCDVCSALSLLHSRRFVHRDVTPRNIRRTRDGKAKLIDFGAMVPFGTHKHAVGTPPFSAPEVVMGQPLDGRADLYSIGATAYYALTGHNAYRARTFDDLRNAWRSRPALPSHYAPDVPPDLDQLVMSLLNLQAARRPASAGAAIERLTAIAGLTMDEQLQVKRSYLSMPSLIDRDNVIQAVRRQMIQSARGRGTSIFLSGPHGVGLSRMVDACALEGKLASGVVLRADAGDAQHGEWGGARSLLDQLVTELPTKIVELLVDRASVLGHIWPRVTELTGVLPRVCTQSQEMRAAVQNALLSLMTEISCRWSLVVTVDDIDRLDEPSRAFVALLAQEVSGRRLVVVTAASNDAIAAGIPGLDLLRSEESTIALQPLSSSGTERLLISIFGEVPNVRLLASRLHDISLGLPATVMEITQHLLDCNAVRFQDGGWLLPTTIEHDARPNGASDLMRARMAQLEDASVALAQAIALSQQATVSIEECGRLMGQSDLNTVLRHVDQLVIHQVLRVSGERYSLGQPAWAPVLIAGIETERKRQIHALIAQMYMSVRSAGYHAAGHLLAAGNPAVAVDALLLNNQWIREELGEDPTRVQEMVRVLPSDWQSTMESVIAAADRLGRPRFERLRLQMTFLYCLAVTGRPHPDIAREVVKQLVGDSGLNDYEVLAHAVPPEQRLACALQRARERYDATREAERGLPLTEAIPALSRVYAQIAAMTAASADSALLEELPSLEPFVPLSPAIAVVQENVRSTVRLLRGQFAQAHEGYLEILACMAEPGGIGLAPPVHRYLEFGITFSVALIETMVGLPTAAERIDVLERDILFEFNAQRLRMVQALQRGDVEMANECMRMSELLKIRNPVSQLFEGSDVWFETLANIEIGDVARLRETLERLNAIAAKYRHWVVTPMMVQGYILRLRGEPVAAVEMFRRALAKYKPAEFMSWAPIARGYLMALAECGRVHDGRVNGAIMLAEAKAAHLTVMAAYLHHGMAAVELTGSDYEAALAHLQSVDEIRLRWPLGVVFSGACHELRAHIAIAKRDQKAFDDAADQCAKAFMFTRNPILIARYQRLTQDAERVHLQAHSVISQSPPLYPSESGALTVEITTATMENQPVLAECSNFEERVGKVLSLATGQSSTKHAMLYLIREQAPKLVAQRGSCPDAKRLNPLVTTYVRGEIEESDDAVIDPDDLVTSTVDTTDWVGPTGTQFAPALLSHPVNGNLAITGVLVFDVEGQRRPADGLLSRLSEALTVANDVVPLMTPARPRASLRT